MRFTKTAEHAGDVTLLVDGAEAGSGHVDRFTPFRFTITDDGLQCGEHWGVPVCDGYRSPARFTGTIHRVVVEVAGPEHTDPAEVTQALDAQ
jgi:arylsulfatase